LEGYFFKRREAQLSQERGLKKGSLGTNILDQGREGFPLERLNLGKKLPRGLPDLGGLNQLDYLLGAFQVLINGGLLAWKFLPLTRSVTWTLLPNLTWPTLVDPKKNQG